MGFCPHSRPESLGQSREIFCDPDASCGAPPVPIDPDILKVVLIKCVRVLSTDIRFYQRRVDREIKRNNGHSGKQKLLTLREPLHACGEITGRISGCEQGIELRVAPTR